MAKPKKKDQADFKGPRSTVTLDLDGTVEDFTIRYNLCQSHYRYWILCNSGVRVRYGNRLVYTTPLEGTFYYVLREATDYVTLVIDGRQGWLVGFITAKGMFQMRVEDLLGLYMDSLHCQLLHFYGSHSDISPHGTGETILNFYFLRRCLHILCSYTGPTRRSEPPGFRTALGLKVILLLEAKFREIFERNCEKMGNPVGGILGNDWVTLLITNWSSISTQIMMFLDDTEYIPHDCGIDELKSTEDLLDAAFYLHLDAYNEGIFSHIPLEAAPRRLIWAPVDPGLGDGDIPVRAEPERPGVVLCRKRVLADNASIEHNVKRRKGLHGGGLGGPPSAPECFVQWEQRNNMKQCDKIISHLCTDLGLEVKHTLCDPLTAKELVPKQKRVDQNQVKDERKDIKISTDDEFHSEQQETNTNPLKDERKDIKVSTDDDLHSEQHEANNDPLKDEHGPFTQSEDLHSIQEDTEVSLSSRGLLASDLKCLRERMMLSSELINFTFNSLAKSVNSDQILLLSPAMSYLIYNHELSHAVGQVENLDLGVRSLVLFPINNNEDPTNPDGGTNWSLLILDQRLQGLRRFVHYDSAGGMNLPFAMRLVETLRPLSTCEVTLEDAQGPQQYNSYDCALFMIATAKEICKCWISSSEDNWEVSVAREVNPASVAALREDLIRRLENYLRKSKKAP